MVIDTSAVLAVLLDEPEAGGLIDRIAADSTRLMSTFTVFEAAVVIESRKGAAGAKALDIFLHEIAVSQVPLTTEHLAHAREAYRRFGKGRHPASLNLGDCVSYALAQYSGEPLLFKGDDFPKSDVSMVES